MVTRCNACIHGSVNNLSKKYECWRFNREKEDGDFFHTRMREDHARIYTKNGMCLYFELKEPTLDKNEKEKITVRKIISSILSGKSD